MEYLYRKNITTISGEKRISVSICDVRNVDIPIDILTVSAFVGGYNPTPGTMLGALYEKNISVMSLARRPAIDLRRICNTWLSEELIDSDLPIGRVGCIEMSSPRGTRDYWRDRRPADMVSSIQAYFRMLDIASISGIKTETIALPILGTGNQHIDMNLITIPIINECIRYLKYNDQIREIVIIERVPQKAYKFVKALENSYTLQTETFQEEKVTPLTQSGHAFISYSSADKKIADNLCAKLESSGIRVWYAPRDIVYSDNYSDYASAIVDGISRCSCFIVILSRNSLKSNHVLNEIDLAFWEMSKRNIPIRPLKIDEEELGPAFRYYLSRQHWMDAHEPPLEKRLDEFVARLLCLEGNQVREAR